MFIYLHGILRTSHTFIVLAGWSYGFIQNCFINMFFFSLIPLLGWMYINLSEQIFYFHNLDTKIIPLLLSLLSLWCLIVNSSSVLWPSNDFIAGCFIPTSEPAAWGRFSVFAAVGWWALIGRSGGWSSSPTYIQISKLTPDASRRHKIYSR